MADTSTGTVAKSPQDQEMAKKLMEELKASGVDVGNIQNAAETEKAVPTQPEVGAESAPEEKVPEPSTPPASESSAPEVAASETQNTQPPAPEPTTPSDPRPAQEPVSAETNALEPAEKNVTSTQSEEPSNADDEKTKESEVVGESEAQSDSSPAASSIPVGGNSTESNLISDPDEEILEEELEKEEKSETYFTLKINRDIILLSVLFIIILGLAVYAIVKR